MSLFWPSNRLLINVILVALFPGLFDERFENKWQFNVATFPPLQCSNINFDLDVFFLDISVYANHYQIFQDTEFVSDGLEIFWSDIKFTLKSSDILYIPQTALISIRLYLNSLNIQKKSVNKISYTALKFAVSVRNCTWNTEPYWIFP